MQTEVAHTVEFRPRAAFSVGITGHRPQRLAAANSKTAYLEATIGILLAKIADSCGAVQERYPSCFSDRKCELRLVSALAAGSDQIATEVARNSGWLVDACLPFSRDEYARDFADRSSRSMFQQLLTASRCVFEMHGSRRDEQGAYEGAGRMILDQSDLLIAIWDGGPARGRGGTAQVVAEAIGQRIPVVRIDPSGTREPELMWSGLDDADLEQLLPETVPSAPASQYLAAVVAALSQPPTDPADLARLESFVRGASRPRRAPLSYPMLLWTVGARRFQRSHFRHAEERRSAAELQGLLEPLSASPNLQRERLQGLIKRYCKS